MKNIFMNIILTYFSLIVGIWVSMTCIVLTYTMKIEQTRDLVLAKNEIQKTLYVKYWENILWDWTISPEMDNAIITSLLTLISVLDVHLKHQSILHPQTVN